MSGNDELGDLIEENRAQEKRIAELEAERDAALYEIEKEQENTEEMPVLRRERNAALSMVWEMLPYMDSRGPEHPIWDVIKRAKELLPDD